MSEFQPVGMEEKPAETGDKRLKYPRQAPAAAIDWIANDRMSERCQMHPDLMCPPSLRMDAQQRAGTKALQQLVPGYRRAPPPRPHGDLLAINGIPAERRVDSTRRRRDLSVNKCKVLLPNLPVLELTAQRTDRRRRCGRSPSPRSSACQGDGLCPGASGHPPPPGPTDGEWRSPAFPISFPRRHGRPVRPVCR